MKFLWSPSPSVACSVVSPERDQPPVAHVMSSPPISLPVKTAVLDGSHSTDDKGGVSYLWTREDTSPAAGVSPAPHRRRGSTNICVFEPSTSPPVSTGGSEQLRPPGRSVPGEPGGGEVQLHPDGDRQ